MVSGATQKSKNKTGSIHNQGAKISFIAKVQIFFPIHISQINTNLLIVSTKPFS